MTRNEIECAFRQGYVGAIRVLECHFQYRYGPQRQFSFYMGAIRIPITSKEKVEKFINVVTKAIAIIWRIIQPKQSRK